MVTEDGAIKVQTKFDGKLYRQCSKKYLILWSIMLALSILLIAAEILCAVFFRELFDIIITICAGVFCACCLIIIITMARSIKKADGKNCYNICEFYADYMQVSGFENDAKISEVKVNYAMLLKYAEVKDYLLAYAAKNVFYPISKQELTADELNTVKALLSCAGTAFASAQSAQFNPYGQAGADARYNPLPPQYMPDNGNQSVFEDFPDNDKNNKGEN